MQVYLAQLMIQYRFRSAEAWGGGEAMLHLFIQGRSILMALPVSVSGLLGLHCALTSASRLGKEHGRSHVGGFL